MLPSLASQPAPQAHSQFLWRRHGTKHMLTSTPYDVDGVAVVIVVTALSRAAPELDGALWSAHKLHLAVSGYGYLAVEEIAVSDIPSRWIPCPRELVPLHIRSDFENAFDTQHEG